MANELVPEQSVSAPGVWDKVIEVIGQFNLPKIIAGPAGEAIARLIGGGADIPAAWLQQKAQAIKNKTEAQSVVSKALAGAAAELVKSDPGLVQRAAEAFVAKEIRHQHNRESIAIKAIEHLKDTPEASTTKPDDDWLNMFARHAQEASSERMQDFWGKILAGQLRAPQSFSLQTLRFASELDEHTANLFERWSAHVVDGINIPYPPRSGVPFSELLHLEDLGLFTGVTGELSSIISDENVIEQNGVTMTLIFGFRPNQLIIEITKPLEQRRYRCAVLTRIGRELYPITKSQSTPDMAKTFFTNFGTANVRKATFWQPTALPEVIWQEPPPAPTQG